MNEVGVFALILHTCSFGVTGRGTVKHIGYGVGVNIEMKVGLSDIANRKSLDTELDHYRSVGKIVILDRGDNGYQGWELRTNLGVKARKQDH